MDFHEDIHRTIEAYQDENEFRRNLNQAIQNSRSVTFLLQKRKAKWPDFDEWYGDWQTAARTNPVLAWGVNSRNRIVKEEDLKTFSQATISYYGERLKEAEDVVVVPPTTTTADMLAVFKRLTSKHPAERKGWVHVQRRWVDDQLPEYELVAALREMYDSVAKIVARAHHASGIDGCLAPRFSRSCVTATIDPPLRCIDSNNPLPSGLIDVATGDLSSVSYAEIGRDEDRIEVGRRRYGITPKIGKDLIEHAEGRMELSRKFLEADGYAGPVLILGRGVSDLRLHAVTFPPRRPREYRIASAIEASGAWPFDGAVFSSEMWLGSKEGRGSALDTPRDELLPSNTSFFDPDPLGNRDEALIVTAVTKDGRSRVLIQPFGRTKSGIVYGSLIDDYTGTMIPAFLRPIWRNWPIWKKGPPIHTDPE